MSKWKEIESYMESKSFHESKFNINKKNVYKLCTHTYYESRDVYTQISS